MTKGKNFLSGLDWSIYLFLLVFFLLFIQVNHIKFFGAYPLSIYESTNVPYNEHYFTDCNPCPFVITVHHEGKFYKYVNVTFSAGFTTSTGYANHVYSINEFGSDCNQPCGPCFKTFTALCQERGWQDRGCSAGGSATASCNPGSCEIACWKDVATTSDWIELRFENNSLLRFERTDVVTTKAVDLWVQINKTCGNQIRDCKNNGNCDYDCTVNFEWYSQNSGGVWNYITMNLLEVPATTTTTTTTQPIYVNPYACDNSSWGSWIQFSYDNTGYSYNCNNFGGSNCVCSFEPCDGRANRLVPRCTYEGNLALCVNCASCPPYFTLINGTCEPTDHYPVSSTTTTVIPVTTTTTAPTTTTITNASTTTTTVLPKQDCPYECCIAADPDYKQKKCPSGSKCDSGNLCIIDDDDNIDEWFKENKGWLMPIGVFVMLLVVLKKK